MRHCDKKPRKRKHPFPSKAKQNKIADECGFIASIKCQQADDKMTADDC